MIHVCNHNWNKNMYVADCIDSFMTSQENNRFENAVCYAQTYFYSRIYETPRMPILE